MRYGLDQPLHLQYWNWIVPLVTQGDFGYSFEWQQPVWTLVADRLWLTIIVSIVSMVFVYAVSIPVALYSATHQYSVGDYAVSFFGIIGLAVPNFLLALVLLVLSARLFGVTPTGLFSPEYIAALAMELGEAVGFDDPSAGASGCRRNLAGTAATIRILRSQLLDEFQKQM